MKKVKLYTLLALLLTTGGVTMQAQEIPSDLTTIYESDSVWFNALRSYNDKMFLAFGGNQEEKCKVLKMSYNGDILDEAPIPSHRMSQWRHGGFYDGKFRYASFRKDDNDTLPMLCVIELDPEDLSWTYYPCQWEGLDFNHPDNSFLYSEMIHSVFSKDGSLLISYPVDSAWHLNETEAMHLFKFDSQGNQVSERIFDSIPFSLSNQFFSAPDSLGCRIILRNPVQYAFDCHTLDDEFNTVAVVEDAGKVFESHPYISGWIGNFECPHFVQLNPYNGLTYSIGCEGPLSKDNAKAENKSRSDLDVFMRVFDEEFAVLNWDWGIINPRMNDEGYGMAFSPEGTVYMMGWMDVSFAGSNINDNLYVAQTDEFLNKQHEIYFKPTDYHVIPHTIDFCPDGGCLVYATRRNTVTGYQDYCIYKITPEDFVSVEEAHLHGLAVATAYPNPGGSTLNIRTTMPNARVEVYDMKGRLIHSQALTENVTEIDAGDWAEGVYVWKVYTLDGGPSTGSGNLVETGKWIKQ